MKLVQSILTKNDCYKSGRKITVKGLMLHSVGCSQPNASVFVKNWNRSGLEACVHGFIDGNTGTVCKQYSLDPMKDGVIISHKEGCARGVASNHGDPEHHIRPFLGTTGAGTLAEPPTTPTLGLKCVNRPVSSTRVGQPSLVLILLPQKPWQREPMKRRLNCSLPLWNQLGTGYTMNGFRKAVQAAMKGGGVTTTPNTGNAATGGTGATVKPYLVRVTISDLYIRKGPGTNYGKNGFIKPGVYTIVAESTGAGATKWGKLKSGAGWISLDYAKAV